MSNELTLIAPDPKLHAEALYDLVCKTFGDYYKRVEDLRATLPAPSFYDWKASRIGFRHGQIVTHVGIYGYQTRLGLARLRTAGVGYVATHGQFRKQGLMERTITATLEACRECGYDISLLFGINDFYHRFGFTRAYSETDYHVPTADLATPAKGSAKKLKKPRAIPLHPFIPYSRPDLNRLFNRHAKDLAGTAVRPTWLKPNMGKLDQSGYLWTANGRPTGKATGYVVVCDRGSRMDVMDAAGDASAVLAAAGQLARQFGADDVRFVQLPYRDSIAAALRRGNVRMETHYRRSGNAMVAMVNLGSTLQKMLPELTQRVRGSGLADLRTSVTLAMGQEEVTLALDGEVKLAAKTPPLKQQNRIAGNSELAQLVFGTDDPMEIVAARGTRLTGRAGQLLPVLFPALHPMLHPLDRF